MKILYLYHDLMNLYGENGNIRVLERRLTDQGERVETECRSLGDTLEFSGYDFLYIGAGTERSQKAALEHLRPYAAGLKAAMADGMHALFTGNAGAMLAREIVDADGKVWPGLGLLDFVSRERRDVRYTGDAIAVHPALDAPLVGFVNKCEDWEGEVPPLLRMTMGRGNRENTADEGFWQGHFMATHLTGPVLVKNPHFHTWLLGSLLGRELKMKHYPYEEKAWQVTYDALRAEGPA